MPADFDSGFMVRAPAWHGQGAVLTEAPKDTDAAYKASGMDWNVLKIPLYYRFPNEKRAFQADEYALVRDKDRSQLGCCKADYEVWQNLQGFQWCKPLVDSPYWQWETAGSLQGGKICWVLLKMDEIEPVKGDTLKRFLLISWAHTGKMSNVVMPTTIRVVCSNTWQAALREGGGHRVIHASTMNWHMTDIRKLYEQTVRQFEVQKEQIDRLLSIQMPDEDLLLYAKAMCMPSISIGNPELEQVAQIPLQLLRTFIVDGQASGAKQLGIKNTAYGAFTAYSEVNEHVLGGARIKDRGANILFGTASDRNAEALRLALEWEQVRKAKKIQRAEVIRGLTGR